MGLEQHAQTWHWILLELWHYIGVMRDVKLNNNFPYVFFLAVFS